MNKIKSLTLLSSILLGSLTANAADFLDTSAPENVFNIGARVGFNLSNNSIDNTPYFKMNLSKWGTGFDAGVVCDINIRNFISIQPGFFYQSRSNDYAYIYTALGGDIDNYGHTRHYTFNVPILASLHLNPTDNIRWSIDFGPYFEFGLDGSDKDLSKDTKYKEDYYASRKSFDIGLKMGTGLEFFDHYYFGIHYLAGCCNIWKEDFDGRNKAWTFTLGYNF